jgi:two-component system response regulator YesN
MYQVIIVDDEPRILEGIIHLFPWNNFGFEVVASFTNGKEALEYINAHPQVDIVMTDIQMPVMTGIELSQKLKNEDIIVIFFSAYQDFEYARAAIINHVTDYLIKPMKYDAMSACFERIRKTLDEREKGHYLPYEANADEADYVTIVKTISNLIIRPQHWKQPLLWYTTHRLIFLPLSRRIPVSVSPVICYR